MSSPGNGARTAVGSRILPGMREREMRGFFILSFVHSCMHACLLAITTFTTTAQHTTEEAGG